MAGEDRSKWLALVAIILGTFVSVLNNSLINIALPDLVNVFGSDTATIQWVLTGFMLASAVVIPLSGYMGDKFGTKKTYLVSLIIFVAASTLCGLAWSDTSLIIFRIIQGLGGGLIMPIGMAIIYSIIPRHQIGMALGLWGVASMSAPAIGPTLSGYLIEFLSWRWLFFLSLPVGAFAIIMGLFLLKETPKKETLTFDKAGAFFSILAFGTLLYALSKGQSEGWTSFYIVSLLFVAVSSLVLFVYVQLTKEEPLIDLRLLKNSTFSLSLLTSGMVTIGMYGGIFLTPIFLQNIQGMTALESGLLLMPQSVAMALMMPISGKLFDKFGVVPLGLIGLLTVGITTYDLHLLSADTSHQWFVLTMTIRGIGIGLCMMPLSTVGTNSVPRHLIGRASSLSNLMRQVLGSFGIALLTTIMTTRQTAHGAMITESVGYDSIPANSFIQSITGLYVQSGVDLATAKAAGTSMLAGLIQKEAAVRAVDDTFLIASIPIFLSLICVLFFIKKKKPQEAVEQGPTK